MQVMFHGRLLWYQGRCACYIVRNMRTHNATTVRNAGSLEKLLYSHRDNCAEVAVIDPTGSAMRWSWPQDMCTDCLEARFGILVNELAHMSL